MAYAGLAVSLVAVLVSTVAFEVNRRAAKDAERHGRMPVLIATRGRDQIGIRNIGNGPALNIVIAQGVGRIATVDILNASLDEYQGDGTWQEHRHLAPVPPGAEHWYRWSAGKNAVVGLTFTDALGHHYTGVSSELGTKVVDGFELTHLPFTKLRYPPSMEHPSGV